MQPPGISDLVSSSIDRTLQELRCSTWSSVQVKDMIEISATCAHNPAKPSWLRASTVFLRPVNLLAAQVFGLGQGSFLPGVKPSASAVTASPPESTIQWRSATNDEHVTVIAVLEACEDPRAMRATRLSILKHFPVNPPTSENHDQLHAFTHSLRQSLFACLHTPAGITIHAPQLSEYLLSDKDAAAAAALLLGLPPNVVWPDDTERAPILYSIGIDYGRSHYLMVDPNDDKDANMVNDICYNKDASVREATLAASASRLGYSPAFCSAIHAQVAGPYRNYAVVRLKLDLIRHWFLSHAISEPRATQLAVRCMALTWQKPLRVIKAVTWGISQDIDSSWNMSLIIFTPLLIMTPTGPAIQVTMTNFVPDSGVWQIRNAIGAGQKRKYLCVWTASLTKEDDKGELRVFDKGEAEAMTDDQRKSFFGVWNSATKLYVVAPAVLRYMPDVVTMCGLRCACSADRLGTVIMSQQFRYK